MPIMNNFMPARPMMGGLGVPGQMGQNTVMPSRPMFGNGPVGLPTPMRGTALQGPQVPGLTGPINGGTNPLQSPALNSNINLGSSNPMLSQVLNSIGQVPVQSIGGYGSTPPAVPSNFGNPFGGGAGGPMPPMGGAYAPGGLNMSVNPFQMGGSQQNSMTGQPGMGPQNGQQMAPQGPMPPMGGMYGGMTAPQRPMGMIPMTGPQGASSFGARFPSQ